MCQLAPFYQSTHLLRTPLSSGTRALSGANNPSELTDAPLANPQSADISPSSPISSPILTLSPALPEGMGKPTSVNHIRKNTLALRLSESMSDCVRPSQSIQKVPRVSQSQSVFTDALTVGDPLCVSRSLCVSDALRVSSSLCVTECLHVCRYLCITESLRVSCSLCAVSSNSHCVNGSLCVSEPLSFSRSPLCLSEPLCISRSLCVSKTLPVTSSLCISGPIVYN